MRVEELQSYKDLVAWQKSFDFLLKIYRVTLSFPAEEKFGLVSQLRRAAVSIPSNIAEGYSRRTRQDYVRFLYIARGSLAEIETQILIAKELDYANRKMLAELLADIDELQRILTGLVKSLNPKP